MARSTGTTWNWWDEGFSTPPKEVILVNPLTAYRVWGGFSRENGNLTRPGVCFSLERPSTRMQAEGLFSVMEYGNACRFVTEFLIRAGAMVYVGRVHPGDSFDNGLGVPGSQVFVPADQVARFVLRTAAARGLVDDLGSNVVVPRDDPGARRSS